MTLEEVNKALKSFGKAKQPKAAQKRKAAKLVKVSLVVPERKLKPGQKIITITRPFSAAA
jgi:hypothetical protein